jgi:hypothetical protein
MNRLLVRGRISVAAMVLAVAGTAAMMQGCSSVTDSLLKAPDPDLIVPGTVQNSEGAQATYFGAIQRLAYATTAVQPGIQEPEWLFSGLLADEWSTSSTFVQNDEVDERNIKTDNASVRDQFRLLARVRTAANQAIAGLKAFRPTELSRIGEMYMIRGFAEMQLAQDYCNGIPLSDGAGSTFVLGTPLTNEAVFNVAMASYDSALALTTATDTTTVRINRAARVAKARTLLQLKVDQSAAAAALLAGIPTNYSYDITHSLTAGSNALWSQGLSQRRYTVGDSLEGNARNLLVKNAIPFFSLQDPRVPSKYTVSANGKDTTKSQDGFTFSRTTSLWGQLTSVALVNGLDARLVEAEAQLRAGNYVTMTATLNALRANPPQLGDVQPTAAQLPPLPPPTSKTAAENLYFREKALWVFGRGERLSDLRRLIRFYGRTPDTTFPVGQHYRGGNYGPDVNFPVPKDEENNPNFTGCLDRNA